MKLIIEKLGTFEIDGDVTFNDTSVKMSSSELFLFVDDLQQEKAPTPPSPPEVKAKVEVTYESAPGCKFSMEKLEKAGWTLSAMIDAGYVIEVEVEVEEIPPAPEVVPTAPEEITPTAEVVLGPNQFELDGSIYEMQAVAKGVTYEKFMETSGWTLALLIKHKFCKLISAPKVEAVPEAPKVEAVPEAPRTQPSKEKMDPGAYPFLNDEGDWEDINGDIFDSDVHGMSKDTKTPSIKNDGAFKARRNVNKKSESVPAAPKEIVAQTIKANDTAAAPPPPADDDTAPPPPADDGSNDANSDEDLDSELANLVKQWGN
jgi:hypothetical protein